MGGLQKGWGWVFVWHSQWKYSPETGEKNILKVLKIYDERHTRMVHQFSRHEWQRCSLEKVEKIISFAFSFIHLLYSSVLRNGFPGLLLTNYPRWSSAPFILYSSTLHHPFTRIYWILCNAVLAEFSWSEDIYSSPRLDVAEENLARHDITHNASLPGMRSMDDGFCCSCCCRWMWMCVYKEKLWQFAWIAYCTWTCNDNFIDK